MSTSLIISTVNGYLKSIGAAPKYMGYGMAGYALGGIISAPLYAYIADKIQSLRIIIHSSIASRLGS
jgi:MFS family permease